MSTYSTTSTGRQPPRSRNGPVDIFGVIVAVKTLEYAGRYDYRLECRSDGVTLFQFFPHNGGKPWRGPRAGEEVYLRHRHNPFCGCFLINDTFQHPMTHEHRGTLRAPALLIAPRPPLGLRPARFPHQLLIHTFSFRHKPATTSNAWTEQDFSTQLRFARPSWWRLMQGSCQRVLF